MKEIVNDDDSLYLSVNELVKEAIRDKIVKIKNQK